MEPTIHLYSRSSRYIEFHETRSARMREIDKNKEAWKNNAWVRECMASLRPYTEVPDKEPWAVPPFEFFGRLKKPQCAEIREFIRFYTAIALAGREIGGRSRGHLYIRSPAAKRLNICNEKAQTPAERPQAPTSTLTERAQRSKIEKALSVGLVNQNLNVVVSPVLRFEVTLDETMRRVQRFEFSYPEEIPEFLIIKSNPGVASMRAVERTCYCLWGMYLEKADLMGESGSSDANSMAADGCNPKHSRRAVGKTARGSEAGNAERGGGGSGGGVKVHALGLYFFHKVSLSTPIRAIQSFLKEAINPARTYVVVYVDESVLVKLPDWW
ncbi:hypothetical protein BDQ12DRAFT_671225 [Crucibulum laeve]|uniref:Uncharacterized protein n=1 Tax=Crucibulum laeve TaxID=68775 RepID=A0A5C3LHZ7_9AGAR|nr:hypothetical protein BDQ12DRAFT_671225 [Crucibulum laeve]